MAPKSKDGRRPARKGEELHGLPVAYWVSQAWLAENLGISTRWIQKLEERGLPARGFRDTCEYPVPHALLWYFEYQLRSGRGKVTRLSPALAIAEHKRRSAIELAEIEYRMATDPEYRAEMERMEREEMGA